MCMEAMGPLQWRCKASNWKSRCLHFLRKRVLWTGQYYSSFVLCCVRWPVWWIRSIRHQQRVASRKQLYDELFHQVDTSNVSDGCHTSAEENGASATESVHRNKRLRWEHNEVSDIIHVTASCFHYKYYYYDNTTPFQVVLVLNQTKLMCDLPKLDSLFFDRTDLEETRAETHRHISIYRRIKQK
jgi:hypothetical protein